ncbi:transglycosylase SLT domain-containing protein [Acetobacter syzygii]|nr:transglycosylase SLT domain-containing protein [Acetobacter syzygii]
MFIPPCIEQIATYYHVQAASIIKIIQTDHEGAIGLMGIQPGWLPLLKDAGFSPDAIQNNVCTNIAAGAWILAYITLKQPAHGQAGKTNNPLPPPRPVSLSGTLQSCAHDAASQYRISEPLFLGILATENGHVGQIVRNPNGSFDMGPAQINSTHLPELSTMGITRDRIINDGCLNIHIGAWILARELGNETPLHPREFWQRVGNYNSRTPVHNHAYQLKVWKQIMSLSHSQPHG